MHMLANKNMTQRPHTQTNHNLACIQVRVCIFKPGYFRIYGNTNKDDNELLVCMTEKPLNRPT